MKNSKTTVVYLLHFDRPLHHARHYLGSALDLETRIDLHRTGKSDVRIMRALFEAGIGFELVRTWKGDRITERGLKGHTLLRLCPLCRTEYLANRQAEGRRYRGRNTPQAKKTSTMTPTPSEASGYTAIHS